MLLFLFLFFFFSLSLSLSIFLGTRIHDILIYNIHIWIYMQMHVSVDILHAIHVRRQYTKSLAPGSGFRINLTWRWISKHRRNCRSIWWKRRRELDTLNRLKSLRFVYIKWRGPEILLVSYEFNIEFPPTPTFSYSSSMNVRVVNAWLHRRMANVAELIMPCCRRWVGHIRAEDSYCCAQPKKRAAGEQCIWKVLGLWYVCHYLANNPTILVFLKSW